MLFIFNLKNEWAFSYIKIAFHFSFLTFVSKNKRPFEYTHLKTSVIFRKLLLFSLSLEKLSEFNCGIWL